MRPNPDNAATADKGIIARGAPPPHDSASMPMRGSAESPQSHAPKMKHCVVSRRDMPREAMLRFVLAPPESGTANPPIIPDVTGKLPGRGAWAELRPDAVREAFMGGSLSHVLRAGSGRIRQRKRKRKKAKTDTAVLADETGKMLGQIDMLLARRVIESLALGRRSGAVLGGGGKIMAEKNHAIAMLLVADDASKREASALAQRSASVIEGVMTGEELGAAFARPSMAFVAILDKAGSDAPLLAVSRLAMWRGGGVDLSHNLNDG